VCDWGERGLLLVYLYVISNSQFCFDMICRECEYNNLNIVLPTNHVGLGPCNCFDERSDRNTSGKLQVAGSSCFCANWLRRVPYSQWN
jgi:hypothetical protein